MIPEIRHAIRSIVRRPTFAAAVIVTLAVGIGANTAIFSVVDGVLWRPLPLEEPELVFVLSERDVFRGDGGLAMSPANFLDLRNRLNGFSGLASFDPGGADLMREGHPETVRSARVSEDFFGIVGLTPILGRTFDAADHITGADPLVILSHDFWRERFGTDAAVVGRTLEIDGSSHTIVGVLPERIPMARETALWLPNITSERDRTNRAGRRLAIYGRLAPDTTEDAARAELSAVGELIAAELPDTNRDVRFEMTRLDEHLVGGVRKGLILLFGAAGLVLLLTTANLANLLLLRALERDRELAVRSAIGATPGKLVRQAAIETALLAVAGGALGIVVGIFGIDLILALGPNTIPGAAEISTDFRVLLFGIGITSLVAVAITLASGRRYARPASPLGLASRGAASARGGATRDLLVAVQIALAFLLLTAAVLLGRSFARVTAVDPGFDPRGVALLQMFVWDRYDSSAERASFFDRLASELERLPWVEAAGASSSAPFAEVKIDIDTAVRAGGEDAALPTPGFVSTVTPRYFDALRIPIVRGRAFEVRDDAAASPVVVLSATMARQLFGDQDPIGRSIRLDYGRPESREVIGVAGDLLHEDLLGQGRAEVYLPHAQTGSGSMTVVVRTSSDEPLTLSSHLQRAVWSVDPLVPIYSTHSLVSRMSESVELRRFILALIAGFSGIALLLGAIGTYGVMSFSTRRRVPELGIRAALGATGAHLGTMVLRHALLLAIAGVAAGIAGALAAGRLIETMLVGVTGSDSLTFAAAGATIVLLAVTAALPSALRAMRVDPVQSLREE